MFNQIANSVDGMFEAMRTAHAQEVNRLIEEAAELREKNAELTNRLERVPNGDVDREFLNIAVEAWFEEHPLDFIQAVKHIRSITGWGLLEAKQCADARRPNQSAGRD